MISWPPNNVSILLHGIVSWSLRTEAIIENVGYVKHLVLYETLVYLIIRARNRQIYCEDKGM